MTNVKRTKVKCPICGKIKDSKGKWSFSCCGESHGNYENRVVEDQPEEKQEKIIDNGLEMKPMVQPPEPKPEEIIIPVKRKKTVCPDCGGSNFTTISSYYSGHPELLNTFRDFNYICIDCMEVF